MILQIEMIVSLDQYLQIIRIIRSDIQINEISNVRTCVSLSSQNFTFFFIDISYYPRIFFYPRIF